VRDVFRPVAKTVIRGYLSVQDSVTEWAAETGEAFSDLVAEAKAEQAGGGAPEARSRTTASGSARRKPSGSSAAKTSE
jgi:hypothetical protein